MNFKKLHFYFLAATLINILFVIKVQALVTDLPPKIIEYLHASKPLNESELKALVSGNTLIGRTCHTQSIYELYFAPDGTVQFRKNLKNIFKYKGKWWVNGDYIYSQWPTYSKKPTVNKIQYYRLTPNTYIPYNVNDACGPAGTFGHAFIVFPGDILKLRDASSM